MAYNRPRRQHKLPTLIRGRPWPTAASACNKLSDPARMIWAMVAFGSSPIFVRPDLCNVCKPGDAGIAASDRLYDNMLATPPLERTRNAMKAATMTVGMRPDHCRL